jgi:hypothetical protein
MVELEGLLVSPALPDESVKVGGSRILIVEKTGNLF